MSHLKTRGLTPGLDSHIPCVFSKEINRNDTQLQAASFPEQLCQEILAQRDLKKEKRRGTMKLTSEDTTYFLHWFPSDYQVGQQADSSAWEMGRHQSPIPCLTHARGNLSAGLRKPGIKPVVNRCQNVQPEHGLIQLHERKHPYALTHSQLSLHSTLAGKLPL